MKTPVHNNTGMPIYVGTSMILPGETRHFHEHEVPHHLRPAAPPAESPVEPPADPMADLLKSNVSDVQSALPGLSDADLERLGELEQLSSSPRKGVLSAVSEEILKRAEAKS
jgi:hypothetical protein